MSTSIIVVIKYYMDCIIKNTYLVIVNGVITSIDQLLEMMIRTSMHQIYNKWNINMPGITKYS